jgi:hypothetical protein
MRRPPQRLPTGSHGGTQNSSLQTRTPARRYFRTLLLHLQTVK